MDPCDNGTLWHRRVADQGDQTGLTIWVRDDIYDMLVTGTELFDSECHEGHWGSCLLIRCGARSSLWVLTQRALIFRCTDKGSLQASVKPLRAARGVMPPMQNVARHREAKRSLIIC